MEKLYNSQRGRPKLLDDRLKALIDKRREKKPEWSARQILDDIHRSWHNNIKLERPKLSDEEIESCIKLPGLNSVQRYLGKKKPPSADVSKCLEKPWHLGLADKYKNDITPEGLYYISSVQKFCESVEKNPDPPFGEYPPLIVRYALWISKLYPFIPYFRTQWETDKKIHKHKFSIWCLRMLYRWAVAYAFYEDIAGKCADTVSLDKALREGAIPVVVERVQQGDIILSSTGGIVLQKGNAISFVTPDTEYLNKLQKKDGEAK